MVTADTVSRDEAEVLAYLVDDHPGLWEVVVWAKHQRGG